MNYLKKNKVFNSFYNILKIKKIFIFNCLNKFNLFNYLYIPNFNKIIFTITITSGLKNETDLKIINSLNVLDGFLNKKTSIDSLLNKYLKKSKNIIFVNKSTINNWNDIYYLLLCINKIISPNLKRKFVYLKFKFLKEGFIFYITDLSTIAEMSNELKKEKVNVKVSFFFNNLYKLNMLFFFLNYFGFIYKN